MSNNDDINCNNSFSSKSYDLKIHELLQSNLDGRSPIQFALIKSNACVFVFKNERTVKFIFEEFAHVQMGWFYFKIKIIKTVEIPLLNENADKTFKNFSFI